MHQGRVAIYRRGVEIDSRCGGLAETTNNGMELTGLLMALAWLATNAPAEPAIVFCDSQYAVRGLNEWMPGWKRKGWRRKGEGAKAENAAIANLDLWKALDAAKEPLGSVKVKWIKGHDGYEGNERADELASIGRQEVMPWDSMSMIEDQLMARA